MFPEVHVVMDVEGYDDLPVLLLPNDLLAGKDALPLEEVGDLRVELDRHPVRGLVLEPDALRVRQRLPDGLRDLPAAPPRGADPLDEVEQELLHDPVVHRHQVPETAVVEDLERLHGIPLPGPPV